MSEQKEHDRQFPVRFTLAQRIVVAEVFPKFSERLRLDEPNQRMVALTLDELKVICRKVAPAIRQADSGMKRTSLRHVLDITERAIEHFQGIGVIPARERIYQFQITLKDIKPPIWRRIQVRDCTLDKLHERIQTAMGWTNSHLHHFQIKDALYGDPWLLDENFMEMNYKDSGHDVEQDSAEERQAVSFRVRIRLRRLLVAPGSLRGLFEGRAGSAVSFVPGR